MAGMNGHATKRKSRVEIEIDMLNKQLQQSQNYAKFHGDPLLGVSQSSQGIELY